jgi:hypothetical protein
MAFILINDTDLNDLGGALERPSLHVTKNDREPNTAEFVSFDYRPRGHSEVVIERASGARVFGGVVQSAVKRRDGRGAYKVAYTVSVGGFSHLLQRHPIAMRFPVQSAGASIRQAVARYNPDIDTSLVQDGPELPVFAFKGYPLELIQGLAGKLGWHWEVDAYKRLVFQPKGETPAPEDLTDTSCNFEDLEVTWDDTAIRNVVMVRGKDAMSDDTTTDTFTGDGITAKRRLSRRPYSTDSNPIVFDRFAPATDYKPQSAVWTEHDVPNPSPPAQSDAGKLPFNSADGYLVVDNFGYKLGACQLVGTGPGAWGQVGLVSKKSGIRQDGLYVLADLLIHANGSMIAGFFDGLGVDITDCLHGVLFEAGAVHIVENGVKVALVGFTTALETSYAVRVVLKAGGGARYEIKGGTFGAYSGRTWTLLANTSTGTATTLYAGLADKSINASIYELSMKLPVAGCLVKVAGVTQIVGYKGTDNAHVDCVLSPEYWLLEWFTTNVPGSGAAIEATYHEPVPVWGLATDGASIEAIKALTGETGERAGWRYWEEKDEDITSMDQAADKAEAICREFGNTKLQARWKTGVDGYAPGQVVGIHVTRDAVDQDFYITDVDFQHFNGDIYDYTITAGSTIHGVADFIARLIAESKRLDWGEDQPLELIQAGEDRAHVVETPEKLTTIPDMDGGEVLTFVELLDRLTTAADIDGEDPIHVITSLDASTLGPDFLPPWLYGSAAYGRALYATVPVTEPVPAVLPW